MDDNFPLPCPCCGAKAFYIEGSEASDQVDLVQCLECYLELMGTREKGSALSKWNKRAPLVHVEAETRERCRKHGGDGLPDKCPECLAGHK